MELRDAMSQITAIHAQLARTRRLRCLRAVPVAFSGAMALLAAAAQAQWIASPLAEPGRWLLLWIGTAAISALAAVLEVAWRLRLERSPLEFANTRTAVEQFAPCLLAGAAVTAFVATRMSGHLWLLPGLWQLLFGLGNLAAWRLLPGPAWAVGGFYLASGTGCLWLGDDALQPLAMGAPFAVGQLGLAALLWWQQERRTGAVGTR